MSNFSRDQASHLWMYYFAHAVLLVIGSVHPPFALLFTLVVEKQQEVVVDKEMEK
jgi:hypothetical protein